MNRGFVLFGTAGAAAVVVALMSSLYRQVPLATPPREQETDAAIGQPSTAGIVRAPDLLNRYYGAVPPCPDSLERDSVDVIIATLPDPFNSRLDWTYDASLEGMRRAFERAGYVLDRFWQPDPYDSAPPPPYAGRREQMPTQEAYPSVFLFRKAEQSFNRLRLLLVVPELPTSGVYQTALYEALVQRDAVRRLRCSTTPELPDTVRIVGPTFSGSALSLRRVLDRWHADSTTAGANPPVVIVTGSATNPSNKERLSSPYAEFWSTVHTDTDYLQLLRRVVMEPLGLTDNEVAILTESSTEYGQRALPGADTPTDYLQIAFPMSISSVRAEYARRPAAERAGPDVPTTLRIPLSLGAEPPPKELPRMHSELTAPAAELVIDQIIEILARRDVRLVGILATDVRDKLFLGEAIKRRLPDVRLFTFESNILYLRPDLNRYMRGMFVATTYPLFLENQGWLDAVLGGRRTPFANQGAEGVYNATLLQLEDQQALTDYGLPGVPGSERPPVWLTVVGKTSLVPVKAVPVGRLSDSTAAIEYVHAGPATPQGVRDVSLSLLATVAFVVFGVLLGMVALYSFRAGSWGGKGLETWAAFKKSNYHTPADDKCIAHLRARVSRASIFLHRELYGALVIVSLMGVFLPPAALVVADQLRHWGSNTGNWGLLLTVFSAIVMLAALSAIVQTAVRATRIIRTLWRDGCKTFDVGGPTEKRKLLWRGEVVVRCMVGVLGIVYLAALLWLALTLYRRSGDPEEWWPLFLRTAQFDSGLSPLLPVILGSVIFLLWSLWQLRRLAVLQKETAFEQCLVTVGSGVGLDASPPDVASFERGRKAAIRTAVAVSVVVVLLALGRYPGFRIALFGVWSLLVVGVIVLSFWEPKPLRQLRERRRSKESEKPSPDLESDRSLRQLAEDGMALRDRLFMVVPDGPAVILWLIVLHVGALIWWSFQRTIDRPALTFVFDYLLYFVILGSLASLTWATYRLGSIWKGLRAVLAQIAQLPLVTAFDRLPPRIARLTGLSLFRGHPAATVQSVTGMYWKQLCALYRNRLEGLVPAKDGAGGEDTAVTVKERNNRAAAKNEEPEEDAALTEEEGELVGSIGRIVKGEQPPPVTEEDVVPADRLKETYNLLRRAWDAEPSEAAARQLEQRFKEDEVSHEIGMVKLVRRSSRGPVALWLRGAEEYLATLVVEYLEDVLEQLRSLALFLLAALVLTTLLLSSYPFYPASHTKLAFVVVLVATVASVLVVMTQMSRNEMLSRIGKTDPGRINWSASYVLTLVIFTVVPILFLVTSEFPGIGQVLTGWLEPVIQMVKLM